jgi:hypothetical protein
MLFVARFFGRSDWVMEIWAIWAWTLADACFSFYGLPQIAGT